MLAERVSHIISCPKICSAPAFTKDFEPLFSGEAQENQREESKPRDTFFPPAMGKLVRITFKIPAQRFPNRAARTPKTLNKDLSSAAGVEL